ncbi:hypothetical protein RLIN73S_04754 [Rhodanobacter lindaniclasticus]
MHVVQRDRRVDQEAEQAGANEVPEAHRHEEHDRPAVARHPRRGVLFPPGVPRLQPDQRQRHHFQRREAGAQRDHRGGGAAEVQVVQGAEHAAGHEHDGGEQHAGGGGAHAQQAQAHEQIADHRGGEHLEEAFHPQVHHPPAPVLDHRDMGVLAPHQAGAVEQADRHGGQEQQADDRGAFLLAVHRRPQRAADQEQPQHQADEQEDLPEAAQVDVLPTLVAEPEVLRQIHLVHHRQPLAGERADHDDQQAHPQEVHPEPLELRLVTGDQRCDVQTGGQPRGGDPQHRQLGMPGAGEGVGQVVGQCETIGLLAFHLVVRGGGAEQDLHQEQGQHRPEILGGGLHRRRRLQFGERVARGNRRQRFVAHLARVVPAEQADAEDQEQHAEHRPHEVGRGGRVAGQRVVRPVLRVADGAVRALGRGGPAGPPEERGDRAALVQFGDGVVAHRVGFAQLGGGRVVREQAHVMRADHQHRLRAQWRDADRALARVPRVRAQLALHARAQCGLVRRVEFGIRGGAFVAGQQLQHRLAFAVQPVGAPVRREQGAVAPDRAQLLATDALPHLLAQLDVVAGEQRLVAAGDHRRGQRRCVLVHLVAHPQQHAKRSDQQGGQAQPQFSGTAHRASPWKMRACSSRASWRRLTQVKRADRHPCANCRGTLSAPWP